MSHAPLVSHPSDGAVRPVVSPTIVTRQLIATEHRDRGPVHTAITAPAGEPSASVDDDGPPFPALANLAHGSYVIVRDSRSPHRTLQTAQVLPDLPFFGVVGTIGSEDPVDFYRLDLSAGAFAMEFGLVSHQTGSPVPLQLQIFNGSGQLLTSWTTSGQGTQAVEAQLSAQAAGSTIYFGISAAVASGAAGFSQPIRYQLWVGLQSTLDQSQTASDPTAAPISAMTALPASASATTPLAPIGLLSSQAVLPGAAAVGGTTSAPASGLAVGSLAIRSGTPYAGVLSSADSRSADERELDTVVQSEWAGQSRAQSADQHPELVELASVSGREQEPSDLVAMNGPGGFSVLEAVAFGHPRKTRDASVNDSVAPPPGEFTGIPIAADTFLLDPVRLADTRPTARENRSDSDQVWRGFPIPVFSMLSLAGAFTLNAILSQPLAGFNFVASHLDALRRQPLPRRRRRSGGDPGAGPAT
jgi:hypothetical protein